MMHDLARPNDESDVVPELGRLDDDFAANASRAVITCGNERPRELNPPTRSSSRRGKPSHNRTGGAEIESMAGKV